MTSHKIFLQTYVPPFSRPYPPDVTFCDSSSIQSISSTVNLFHNFLCPVQTVYPYTLFLNGPCPLSIMFSAFHRHPGRTRFTEFFRRHWPCLTHSTHSASSPISSLFSTVVRSETFGDSPEGKLTLLHGRPSIETPDLTPPHLVSILVPLNNRLITLFGTRCETNENVPAPSLLPWNSLRLI